MPLSDDEVKKRYLTFRKDPANVQFEDIYFCSTNSVSGDRLRRILKENPKITQEILSREVTDDELGQKMSFLARSALDRSLLDKVPIKSIEGLINALVAYMKQRALESGKPTEIFKIKYEELKKKTPQELQQHLLGLLRHANN